MRALDRKLFRDIKRLWAQSLAVALVMAAGIATLLLGLGAYNSLSETRSAYYDRNQFADIFATAVTVPKSVEAALRQIDGVSKLETRITKTALLDIPGFNLPVTGYFISLPEIGDSTLNKLYLRSGRLPETGSAKQVAVNESFAKAHGFQVGSEFDAILNGSKRHLTISAIVLSPEFIYALGPGDMMPDDKRFGIVWMRETALADIFKLRGAFNNISLTVSRNAIEKDILLSVDHILKRYGGEGAYGRTDQLSHAFLDAELKQLSAMSRILPPTFLIVAAFLVNMVLARLIALEREQVGLLKAIGYTPTQIALHYGKLVILIACFGVVIGLGSGIWLSRELTKLYSEFFHFPFQIYVASPLLYASASLIAVAAALAGAARAVFAAASLSPAIAMQAPTPPIYRRFWSGRLQPFKYFSQLTIMVFRHILRWPLRSLVTTFGIALSAALLVASLFSVGAINFMIDVTFDRIDREDATITFGNAKPTNVLAGVGRLSGVLVAEPYRAALARLSNGNHTKRVAIIGKPGTMDLSRVMDMKLRVVKLPGTGLVLGDTLANQLQVKRGETVHAEFLGRSNLEVDIPVVDIIQSYMGLAAFMNIDAMNHLLRESPSVNGIHLLLDPAKSEAFFAKVKETPALSAIALQRLSLAKFRESIAENINIQIIVYSSLAIIIAFGVVYNSARIQFAEQARELASLRVLGFTQGEVSMVLLLEFALMTIVAVPLGWAMGYSLAAVMVGAFQSDLYRLPFIIVRSTYAYSGLIVISAVAVSALIVRRRVNKLDLVSVLKTRD
jgi:putative ABC transport system permease protein